MPGPSLAVSVSTDTRRIPSNVSRFHCGAPTSHAPGVPPFILYFLILILTHIYRRILRIAHELETLEQDLMGHDDTLAVREAASLFRNTCQQGSVYRVGRVQNLYKQLAPLLARVAHHHPHLYHKAAFISKQMVALELIPEAWKQAQFLHVAHFSDETW